MAYKSRANIVPSAARTTTGNSGVIGISELGNTISIGVDVTAQSGTGPTALFTVEWSFDGVSFFQADGAVDTFTSIGAVTPRVVKSFPIRAPFYRVVWTLAGTSPSYTFALHEYVTA